MGALGKLVGDNIMAGRIVALCSTGAIALLIGAIARCMGCRKTEATLSALIFAGGPWILSDYAMFDDPQMLGQALGCAGFALVLRAADRKRSNAPGTLLLALAGFVKHIFIAQPLALIVWLFPEKPRAALSLIFYGAVFAAIGIAATDFAYRTSLIAHMASPRVYEFTRTLGHPATWLITQSIPLAATLFLFRFRDDRHARLCAIYAAVAVALGVFFSGGQGVGGNALFDASIAVALGTGVCVNRLRAGTVAPAWFGAHPIAKIVIASTLPMAIVLAASLFAPRPPAYSIVRSHTDAIVMADADIGFFEAHHGPVLCEALAFCYWAHKGAEVDAFGLPEAFKSHARDPHELTRKLDAHYFSAIQLNPRTAFAYSTELLCAFVRDYRVEHSDAYGEFLVPRDGRNAAVVGPCPGRVQ